jgi:hypothetical protein
MSSRNWWHSSCLTHPFRPPQVTVTVGAAVQAMLVGMPAPRDLHRSEVDGQVFVAVGATVLFS